MIRVIPSLLAILLMTIGHLEAAEVPSEGDPIPKEVSQEPTYGYTEENPIKVGRKHGGPKDEQLFLESLLGPDGQTIKFKRLGSCCSFKTPNAWMNGEGLLDTYEVKYKGIKKPLTLYFNFYDYEQPKIPLGFTKRK